MLYTSFAPTGAPALAELGHPDVATGRYSCVTRSHDCGKPFRTESAGRRPDLINCATTAPKYLSAPPGELSAVPHPSIPLPRFRAHSSQAEEPRFVAADEPHPLLHLPGEGGGREKGRGEAGMFRRDIRVSEAERGRVPCRSKEHTASTRPTEPNRHIQPKK